MKMRFGWSREALLKRDNIIEINIKMKSNRVKEDYNNIIDQIDSLKNNIAQLINVKKVTTRTPRLNFTNDHKSSRANIVKTSRTNKKKSEKLINICHR
jgi:hypothetical protein